MILFAYDFPHRKTQDFISYLKYYNFKLDVVIGAPKQLIKVPEQQYHSQIEDRRRRLDNSSIVYFHGKPKPHELTEDWVKVHWV